LREAQSEAIEIVHRGVGGYDVLNEVASFEQAGARLDPDVVALRLGSMMSGSTRWTCERCDSSIVMAP